MGPFSLYYSLSFNHLLDNVPAVIAPFTFSAVRPISINGSIEINKPTNSNGRFKVDNTTIAAKVAPPPTPAIPKEEISSNLIVLDNDLLAFKF